MSSGASAGTLRLQCGEKVNAIARPGWCCRNARPGNHPHPIGWHVRLILAVIFFARMGLTAEAADYNTRKLRDAERRFPTFWEPGHDWVPDHNWGGSGMTGLQEMLLQTIGDQIVLFPAWPKDWDVDFKLHAPGQTVVERVLKEGQLKSLHVTTPSRAEDVASRLQAL